MTEYRIATAVLEDIVRGSLVGKESIRIQAAQPLARSKAIDVNIHDDKCEVEIHLHARLGENLPVLASEVRSAIAAALTRMTGLAVSAVDVIFVGVFPPGK